jgi:hypothetical protein
MQLSRTRISLVAVSAFMDKVPDRRRNFPGSVEQSSVKRTFHNR